MNYTEIDITEPFKPIKIDKDVAVPGFQVKTTSGIDKCIPITTVGTFGSICQSEYKRFMLDKKSISIPPKDRRKLRNN